MKVFWKTIGFMCAVCATIHVCISVAYLFYPTQYGRARANFDIMRNHYEIRYYGLTFMDDAYYSFFRDYGIKYVRVAGCVVNFPIIDSTRSYNETMKDAIRRDLGLDVDSILKAYRLDLPDQGE